MKDLTEPLGLTTDHVDDSPLLGDQPELLGLQPMLDAQVPAHATVCVSAWIRCLDKVSVTQIPHILSEADHRLNQVDP